MLECFIKNLKGIQVRLMTEIHSIGKENSCTVEGQPWSLGWTGRVEKLHSQVCTSISQLLNPTADLKMVKSHTIITLIPSVKVQNIPSYQAAGSLLQPCC